MVESSPSFLVDRIVSGGQTGVDRGGLQAAIALDIEHGGWCPRGRLAEDGPIPPEYRLVETKAAEYWVRTEQNVVDSDGTLILYRETLSGGTKYTHKMAKKHKKPFQLVDLTEPIDIDTVRSWLVSEEVRVLNVAGPRESSQPGISAESRDAVLAILTAAS